VQGNLHARFQGGERPKGPTYPNGITNAEPGTGYQEGPLKEVERPVTSLLEPCAVKVARTVPRGGKLERAYLSQPVCTLSVP